MARQMALDIHQFTRQYEYAQRHLQTSSVGARNKELILGFRDACLLRQVCGKVRLTRAFYALTQCALVLAKDADQVTRQDVERLLTVLMEKGLTPNTLSTYKAILKRFLTYVSSPDAFPHAPPPPAVAWLRTHVRKSEQRRLQRNDLLTPDDVQQLVSIARNPRDRALISILWETGGRISEIGNLQVKHATKNQHGYILDLEGKTGRRSPLIVSSAPYLSQWLANHPFRDNPESPLWIHNRYNNQPRPMCYSTIRTVLNRYFTRASIKKKCNPHLFRHSRSTFLLSQGIMNESQAKSYFGWTPDSDMIGTYSHLIDQDANNAILRENNFAIERERYDELRPSRCHVCNELNQPGNDYCTKCSAVLNLKKAYEHQQVHNLQEGLSMAIFQLLVEKGLVDDAAKAVHDAGLGSALKRLIEHRTSTPRPDSSATTVQQPPSPIVTGPAEATTKAG